MPAPRFWIPLTAIPACGGASARARHMARRAVALASAAPLFFARGYSRLRRGLREGGLTAGARSRLPRLRLGIAGYGKVVS